MSSSCWTDWPDKGNQRGWWEQGVHGGRGFNGKEDIQNVASNWAYAFYNLPSARIFLPPCKQPLRYKLTLYPKWEWLKQIDCNNVSLQEYFVVANPITFKNFLISTNFIGN